MLSVWGGLYLGIDAGLLVWALRGRDVDCKMAGTVLLVLCVLSNLSTFSTEGWGVYYPLMDLMAGVGFAVVWAEVGGGKMWLLVMAGIFALMMGWHVGYARGVLPAHWYDLGLNGLQLGQGALLAGAIWKEQRAWA